MIPVGLLIIVNMLIIYIVRKFSPKIEKSNDNDNVPNTSSAASSIPIKKTSRITRMILFITFLYIALALPGALLSGYFYSTIYVYPWAQLSVNIVNAVQFSYPALNFFILYASNKQFATETKKILF